MRLRQALGLYAILRPIQNLPGLTSRYAGVDLLLIREGTEDLYAGIEFEVVPGVAQSIKVTTRAACLRICRFAFELAKQRGRRAVTLVHKANIMKQADGLFLRSGEEVAADYPDITFRTIIADNACMQLVRAPQQFDVLVAQNLFGDILADLGAGIVGGISAVWGECTGDDDIHVFEVLHGIAPALEGKGVANPLPFLLPTKALLSHLGETAAAERLGTAISRTLEDGIRPRDLGGTAGTAAFVDALLARI
jgi:isocitrate dehydrogenase (NAD+)